MESEIRRKDEFCESIGTPFWSRSNRKTAQLQHSIGRFNVFSLPDSSILEENPPQVWFKKKAGVDDQPKFRWPTRSHPLASKNGFHRPPEDGAPFPRTPWSEDQSSWRCNSWCPPSRRFRVASKLTVRYWKWPFLVELPIDSMVDLSIANCNVLPPQLWSPLVCENVGKMVTTDGKIWVPKSWTVVDLPFPCFFFHRETHPTSLFFRS